jgi:hypothetical protein
MTHGAAEPGALDRRQTSTRPLHARAEDNPGPAVFVRRTVGATGMPRDLDEMHLPDQSGVRFEGLAAACLQRPDAGARSHRSHGDSMPLRRPLRRGIASAR